MLCAFIQTIKRNLLKLKFDCRSFASLFIFWCELKTEALTFVWRCPRTKVRVRLTLYRTRTFERCQNCNLSKWPFTAHHYSVVYEDQCASDLFDERTTISLSEYSKLVLLYVVHVYDVQKIQYCWRTLYFYTHTYKSTRQNSLVCDRVDAP